jgi:hypothetical protein
MKHIELQHSTDLFARIKGFNTPEQIEKWKAERRNNFPTPENIARKKAEMLERRSRGEHFSSRKIEDSGIMCPGAKDVFRYKIIPEDRKRRKPEWRGRKGHPAYQSSGDDDYLEEDEVSKGSRNFFCQ